MLSILIPAYNYAVTTLVQELHSQCLQSGITFEIIVIDDSPTSALSIQNKNIAGLKHYYFIQNEVNLGRTLTRKKLAESAQYKTLLFLDADVIPADEDFIKRYIAFIGTPNQIVVGGYAYRYSDADATSQLRLKYGMEREQKTAAVRNKNPFGSIFSGNFMIDKAVFLQNNYPENHNFYGMDNYFSYSLFINKVSVVHINNNIYHLGLESDAVFFNKCLQSVRVRKQLLADKPGINTINSLIRYYNTLKKYHLKPLVRFAFRLTEPFLKKMIMKKDPNLFCLDLYRLGYICTSK